MSQQHQYDELSCRDMKVVASEQNDEHQGYFEGVFYSITFLGYNKTDLLLHVHVYRVFKC